MDTKLLICTHRNISIPMIQDKEEYMIMHSCKPSDSDFGFTRIDTLDNIADLNYFFAELDVHYWAWKNIHCDNIGLFHYHRFLYYDNHILTKDDVEILLTKYDFLVPRFFPISTTVKTAFERHTHPVVLNTVYDIIKTYYPEYLPTYNQVIYDTKIINFNILVTRKELFNAYCEWLFDILFKLYDIIIENSYLKFLPARGKACGFVAEFLFDVYLFYNHFSYCHLPVVRFPHQQFVI